MSAKPIGFTKNYMIQATLSTSMVDEFSDTSKVQRDKWSRPFWKYLDENLETGEIIRRWQKAGCDPRNIAISIHRYLFGYLRKLEVDRKKRKKNPKDIITTAVRSSRNLDGIGRVHRYPLFELKSMSPKRVKELELSLSLGCAARRRGEEPGRAPQIKSAHARRPLFRPGS
jgi:hypothetical protein